MNNQFDFNKIIPEPTSIEECPEPYRHAIYKPITPDNERPWFDWWSWRIYHWGTKWNACDVYLYDHEDYIIIEFNTAWSPCNPIIFKLIELHPELTFDYYFYEGGQWYAGSITKDEEGYALEYIADDYIKQFTI